MLFYGKSPYSELFDHKGPLIFLLYGVGYAINPGNFFGVALIEIIFTYLTLKWGYRLSNFFTKGILCTIIPFYLPLCYLLMSAGHPAEFLIPFQILSLIYFFEYFYSRNILLPSIKLWNLGMIVSFAFWLKFNLCSFWLVPLFFILFRIWKQAGARRLLKSVSHFSGGFMAITMPILIYYGIQGTLNDLYECYFSYNFSYGTEAQPFAWFTWRLFLKGITFGGCSLLMIFSNYTVWKHTKSVPFLIAWIAGILITWIADFMGGRAPYNYFIILLPYAFIGLVGLMELVKEKLQWKLFYSRKLYLLAILCPLAASSYNFYQKFTGKLKENNRGAGKNMCPLAIHYRPTNHTLHGPFLRVCTTSSCLPEIEILYYQTHMGQSCERSVFLPDKSKSRFSDSQLPLGCPHHGTLQKHHPKKLHPN